MRTFSPTEGGPRNIHVNIDKPSRSHLLLTKLREYPSSRDDPLDLRGLRLQSDSLLVVCFRLKPLCWNRDQLLGGIFVEHSPRKCSLVRERRTRCMDSRSYGDQIPITVNSLSARRLHLSGLLGSFANSGCI